MIIWHRTLSSPRLAVSVGLALVLSVSSSVAQHEAFYQSWRWAKFAVAHGLPSNQVFAVAETPARTIWAGTQKGLAWFDNYQWHTVEIKKDREAPSVMLMETYGGDSLLVVVDSAVYLGTTKGFHLLVPFDEKIQSLVPVPGGAIYILTGQTLWMYNQGRLHRLRAPAQPMQSGGKNLWKTSSGSIWLNTVRGLYRGNGKSWTRVLPASPTACFITTVVEDGSGNGLAAVDQPSEATGVWEWTRNSKPSKSSTERSRFPQTMDASPAGTVIVVYQSGDVRIRHRGVWSSETAPPLAFSSTHVVKYRDNGDLWLGTDEGLFLFKSFTSRWAYWRHPFADLRNYSHEISRISDGSIWMGTLRGIEIHRPNGRVEYIEEILGTTLGTVTGIVEDGQHNIWVSSGASFEGAFQWNGKRWKHFGPAVGLTAERIHKIRLDRKGRPWFLGLGIDYRDPVHQPGAFVYEHGTFKNWPARRDSVSPGLVSGRVYSFAEGRDGAYWFGTLHGLSRWQGERWTHWDTRRGFADQNPRVFALAVDSNGSVWFSNEGSGLGLVSKSDSLRFYTTDDGLVNNIIWDLKADESGGLWIATRGGLSYYANGLWSNVTLRNGLNSLSLWDILPLKDKVYIGTRGSGVNILNRSDEMHPPFLLMDPPTVQESRALVRWRAFSYFGEMEPEDIRYRHRLDDGAWSDWQKEAELSLNELSVGNHEVEIQARGAFGAPSEPAKAHLLVEPPLYRRPEVIIALSFLAVTIAFLSGANWRRERKHKRQLEQSDERFRLIASSTTDVIYDWNFTTKAVWSNEPNRLYTSTPSLIPDDAFNTWLDHVSEEDRDRIRTSYHSIISRKSPEWHEEYRYRRTDGTYGHLLHRVLIFYDDNGNPARIIGSGMDISERKDAEELSRHLSRRILEAQEGERRRVSRELHDSVNQILASVKFRIESLEEQLTGRSLRFRREAGKTKQLLNKVMNEVRRISRNLRPAELDDLGLASAVRSLAEEFTERTGIDVTLLAPWPKSSLSPEITETLYRIIQEALMNVEKHSSATRVIISFTASDENLVCSISDNGRGMQPDDRGKSRSKSGGLGIVDIRERLSFLKGWLEIGPRGKGGTTLTVHIPLGHQSSSTTTPS
ncbi:MAG: hypothetical protein A2X66_08895 [Ignavibacteria bacterium GWA2_54_16]|nr:MAG: hypothetical protein A2X66_08895 [Ignavibacteria bacterium GWA2_54_16]